MNQPDLSNADLPTTTIGSLTVGRLGLGLMGMSYGYGPGDRTESLATINHALDQGVTLLDTSDAYGEGRNEELLAEVLRTRRDEATVATKCGLVMDPATSRPSIIDGSPEHIRSAADASLRRLGTDHIDLYYLHRVDPKVPIEDSVGAMAELAAAGKIREVGLSEASADVLRRACAVHPIAALQSEWSLFSRTIEDDMVPVARKLGVTIVPYSPLGRGMLTGAPPSRDDLTDDDFRRTLPRWDPDALEANLAQVEKVTVIADAHGATPAQVALAWLLSRGDDIVPIPGTKRRRWLNDNLGAFDVALSEDDLITLDALSVSGDRYRDMDWVAGRDGASAS